MSQNSSGRSPTPHCSRKRGSSSRESEDLAGRVFRLKKNLRRRNENCVSGGDVITVIKSSATNDLLDVETALGDRVTMSRDRLGSITFKILSRDDLDLHQEFDFQCCFCSRFCQNRRAFFIHLSRKHFDDNVKEILCEKSEFKTVNEYLENIFFHYILTQSTSLPPSSTNRYRVKLPESIGMAFSALQSFEEATFSCTNCQEHRRALARLKTPKIHSKEVLIVTDITCCHHVEVLTESGLVGIVPFVKAIDLEEPLRFKCPFCPNSKLFSNDKASFKKHLQHSHLRGEAQKFVGSSKKCPKKSCPIADHRFNNSNEVVDHLLDPDGYHRANVINSLLFKQLISFVGIRSKRVKREIMDEDDNFLKDREVTCDNEDEYRISVKTEAVGDEKILTDYQHKISVLQDQVSSYQSIVDEQNETISQKIAVIEEHKALVEENLDGHCRVLTTMEADINSLKNGWDRDSKEKSDRILELLDQLGKRNKEVEDLTLSLSLAKDDLVELELSFSKKIKTMQSETENDVSKLKKEVVGLKQINSELTCASHTQEQEHLKELAKKDQEIKALKVALQVKSKLDKTPETAVVSQDIHNHLKKSFDEQSKEVTKLKEDNFQLKTNAGLLEKDNGSLTARNAILTNQIEKLKNEAQDVNSIQTKQIKSLEELVSKKDDELKSKDAIIFGKTRETEALEKQVQDLKGQLETATDNSNSRLAAKDKTIAELSSKLEELDEEVNVSEILLMEEDFNDKANKDPELANEKRVEEFKVALQNAHDEVENCRSVLKKKDAVIDEMARKIQNQAKSLTAYSKKMAGNKTSIANLEKRVRDLTEDWSGAVENLKQKATELTKVKVDLELKDGKMIELESRVQETDLILKPKEDEIEWLQRELNKAEHAKADLSKELEHLKSLDLLDCAKKLDATVKEKEKVIDELKLEHSKVASLTKQIDEKSKLINLGRDKYKRQEARVFQQDKEIAALCENSQKSEAEKKGLRENIASLEVMLKKHESNNKIAEVDKAALDEEVQTLKNDIKEMTDQMDQKQTEVDHLQKSVKASIAERDEAQQDRDEDAAKFSKQIQDLVMGNRELNDKHCHLEVKYEALVEKYAKLKKQAAEQNKQILAQRAATASKK